MARPPAHPSPRTAVRRTPAAADPGPSTQRPAHRGGSAARVASGSRPANRQETSAASAAAAAARNRKLEAGAGAEAAAAAAAAAAEANSQQEAAAATGQAQPRVRALPSAAAASPDSGATPRTSGWVTYEVTVVTSECPGAGT